MATIVVTPDTVTVRLTATEKVGALHGDLSIPRTAIAEASVVDEPMSAVSGVRAPGYAMPGHANVGTFRRHEGKDFVAVYAGRRAVELRLTGQQFVRVLVSVEDADAVVAELS